MVVVSGGPKLLLDRRASTPAPPTASPPARPPRRGPRSGWRRASLSGGTSSLKDNSRLASSGGGHRQPDLREVQEDREVRRATERKSEVWSTLPSASAWIIRSDSATNGADIRKERVDQ